MVSTTTRWPVYAGFYVFVVVVLLLVPLGVFANTVLEILGIQNTRTTFLFPVSAAGIGAALWWLLVERRRTHTYVSGAIFGAATAFVTVLCWSLIVALMYGPGVLVPGSVVILFVLVVTIPAGLIAGLPMMYARRRRDIGLMNWNALSRTCEFREAPD